MEIVQRWKDKINWYQPTTDTKTWQEFANTTYNVNYANATVEDLKRIAWRAQKITSGADEGMWKDRAERLRKFLNGDMGLGEANAVEKQAIQYDFVACFLNPYSHAAHNKDLWESIDNAARAVLKEDIEPTDTDADEQSPIELGLGWRAPAIGRILFSAFKRVNLSYYRPTEDTNTWAYFQEISFDLSLLPSFRFLFRHAYLYTTVRSGPDRGVWGDLAAGASTFLDVNLGRTPANPRQEFELAIQFCETLQFNWQHAAHNKDLFQAYTESFKTAETRLQLLIPPA